MLQNQTAQEYYYQTKLNRDIFNNTILDRDIITKMKRIDILLEKNKLDRDTLTKIKLD